MFGVGRAPPSESVRIYLEGVVILLCFLIGSVLGSLCSVLLSPLSVVCFLMSSAILTGSM